MRPGQRTRCLGVLVAALALTAITVASSPAAPAPPVARVLSASVMPSELTYGAGLTVSGSLVDAGQGVGGAPLALQADSYPFRGFAAVARLTTGPDGSFAFVGVRPDRNTRLRVLVEGAPAAASPVMAVVVDPNAATNARSLGPGRTRLSLRLRHTQVGGSASVSAWWFLAARGTRVFHLAAVTLTHELASGVTYASATVDPSSKRFAYRVCLNPTWEPAMGTRASHGPCPQHDFSVPHDVG